MWRLARGRHRERSLTCAYQHPKQGALVRMVLALFLRRAGRSDALSSAITIDDSRALETSWRQAAGACIVWTMSAISLAPSRQ